MTFLQKIFSLFHKDKREIEELRSQLDLKEGELIAQIELTEQLKRENKRLEIQLQYATYYLEEEREKNNGSSVIY